MKTALSRAIVLALAPAAFTALSLAPAQAASGGYSATLAAPLAAPKQAILGEALWKCAGNSCTGGNMGGRPVLTCQKVVKEFGAVSRFVSGAKEFSAEELAKCNGK